MAMYVFIPRFHAWVATQDDGHVLKLILFSAPAVLFGVLAEITVTRFT